MFACKVPEHQEGDDGVWAQASPRHTRTSSGVFADLAKGWDDESNWQIPKEEGFPESRRPGERDG